MVTIVNGKFVGLSSDVKPTGYDNGFAFEEIDTGKTYRYDAAGKVWICPSTYVVSIAITTAPTKVSYYVGDTFVATGMVVTATYGDGSTGVVTGYTVKPTGALKTTDTHVTITYSGKTATQAITVTPVTVESIAVATAPTKVAYTSGETLTMAGLVLTVTYNNQSTATVGYGTTGIVYSPEEGTAVTESGSVTITYAEKSCTQAITYS